MRRTGADGCVLAVRASSEQGGGEVSHCVEGYEPNNRAQDVLRSCGAMLSLSDDPTQPNSWGLCDAQHFRVRGPNYWPVQDGQKEGRTPIFG
jgi:hypothetical protein